MNWMNGGMNDEKQKAIWMKLLEERENGVKCFIQSFVFRSSKIFKEIKRKKKVRVGARMRKLRKNYNEKRHWRRKEREGGKKRLKMQTTFAITNFLRAEQNSDGSMYC